MFTDAYTCMHESAREMKKAKKKKKDREREMHDGLSSLSVAGTCIVMRELKSLRRVQ